MMFIFVLCPEVANPQILRLCCWCGFVRSDQAGHTFGVRVSNARKHQERPDPLSKKSQYTTSSSLHYDFPDRYTLHLRWNGVLIVWGFCCSDSFSAKSESDSSLFRFHNMTQKQGHLILWDACIEIFRLFKRCQHCLNTSKPHTVGSPYTCGCCRKTSGHFNVTVPCLCECIRHY